jgi:hypothetical protein
VHFGQVAARTKMTAGPRQHDGARIRVVVHEPLENIGQREPHLHGECVAALGIVHRDDGHVAFAAHLHDLVGTRGQFRLLDTHRMGLRVHSPVKTGLVFSINALQAA